MALRDKFIAIFEANKTAEPYAPTPEQIAQRSLKNVALSYLMSIEDEQGIAFCEVQFAADLNMT